jgi:hypothetical protein
MKSRLTTDAREEWKRSQIGCFHPGCQQTVRNGDLLDCHEIVGGADRQMAMCLPSTWLLLCRYHHDKLGSRPTQTSLIEQLAWKKFSDPEHHHPTQVIRLWRPRCTAELVSEILKAVDAEYRRLVREYR